MGLRGEELGRERDKVMGENDDVMRKQREW